MQSTDQVSRVASSTAGSGRHSDRAAFVLPHFSTGSERELDLLSETLNSIEAQTDENWGAILVDDGSPAPGVRTQLARVANRFGGRLEVVHSDVNLGPGHARNLGVKHAERAGYSYVLFLDADDLAHPSRVEVTRRLFAHHPEVGVVYSTFEIIDELGRPVPRERLTPSILEILEVHDRNPPQGEDVWVTFATETGYVNLTSATAVRTSIALASPFPSERVSEDFFAWLAYSARGARYLYTPVIPAKYRIPQHVVGSASRSREGGAHEFNTIKSRVDVDGFENAVALALARGSLNQEQVRELSIRFFLRRAVSMRKDGERDLAEAFYRRALSLESAET